MRYQVLTATRHGRHCIAQPWNTHSSSRRWRVVDISPLPLFYPDRPMSFVPSTPAATAVLAVVFVINRVFYYAPTPLRTYRDVTCAINVDDETSEAWMKFTADTELTLPSRISPLARNMENSPGYSRPNSIYVTAFCVTSNSALTKLASHSLNMSGPLILLQRVIILHETRSERNTHIFYEALTIFYRGNYFRLEI